MIDPDTDRRAVRSAVVEEVAKLTLQLLQLVCILGIGVLHPLEDARRIVEVAGIDPHLLHMLGSLVGGLGIEVHIGNQRDQALGLPEPVVYQTYRPRLPHALCREANQFSSRLGDPLRLRYARLDVVGIHIGHRLDHDRVPPSDDEVVAYVHRRGGASPVFDKSLCHRVSLFYAKLPHLPQETGMAGSANASKACRSRCFLISGLGKTISGIGEN